MNKVQSERIWIQIGGELPPLDQITSFVQRNHCGAVNLFEGRTRDHEKGRDVRTLFYDCYNEMALKQAEKLGRDILQRYPLGALAILHRTGEVPISETSMIIAVSAPHRREAIDATLELIDRIKKDVPIWKKEQFANQTLWKEEQNTDG